MTEIAQGWTSPLVFVLKLDNALIPGGLAGMTVTAVAFDRLGRSVALGGTTSVIDSVNCKVSYTPVAADFTAALSPYSFRFKLVSGSVTAFVPNGIADIWVVRE